MPVTGNFLNPSIVRLELLFNGQELSTGTGFFILMDGEWFLVTNWHVLAGSHPATGLPLHRSGGLPNECRYHCPVRTGHHLSWEQYTYPLGDPATGETRWFQHPIEGQDVDIAVLPVVKGTTGAAKNLLDPNGNDPDMWVDLGDDLFLPGYPLGLSVNGMFAIWKRASLASSLEYGEGITRKFLVDTASREGMSGSPCLAMPKLGYYHVNYDKGDTKRIDDPFRWRWLGVYSGRLNPSNALEAQLGIVWRSELAIATVQGKKPGRILIR